MPDIENPKVGLKELSKTIGYDFLDSELNCPVIVNASLGRNEIDKLLTVLKRNPVALGYTLSDLQGINPFMCMHQIMLERVLKPLEGSKGG